MKFNFRNLIKEPHLFALIAFLSIINYLFVKYIPSFDGPQHLHNVNVLVQLLKDNSSYEEYVTFNPVIVGYWAGHFFLSLFHYFLPAFLAEKLFIILYLFGMFYSFRYLVKAHVKEPSYLTFLIFPFALNTYFLLGYYNFSFAFIFFFLVFGYWIRHEYSLRIKNAFLLSILFLALFLSHAFVFSITGLSLLIYMVFGFIFDLKRKTGHKKILLLFLKKILYILIAATPAIILWSIYIFSVMGIDDTVRSSSYSFWELIRFLLRIRQLVGFSHHREAVPYTIFFVIICSLIIFKVYSAFRILKYSDRKSGRHNQFYTRSNIWIIISLIFLVLYFFFPDQISAGSLTNRIGLIFFFTLIIWLASKSFPKPVQVVAIILLLSTYAYQKIWHHNPYMALNADISEIKEVEKSIEPNSTIYPVLVSKNWIHLHFLDYIGIDKPIINISGPECYGQFPLVWNKDKLPLNFVGPYRIYHYRTDEYTGEFPRKLDIADYVVIFDHIQFKAKQDNLEFKSILESFYTPVDSSSQRKVVLYKFAVTDSLQKTYNNLMRMPKSESLQLDSAARSVQLIREDYLWIEAMELYQKKYKQKRDIN